MEWSSGKALVLPLLKLYARIFLGIFGLFQVEISCHKGNDEIFSVAQITASAFYLIATYAFWLLTTIHLQIY